MGHENEVEPPRRCVGFAKKKAKKKTKKRGGGQSGNHRMSTLLPCYPPSMNLSRTGQRKVKRIVDWRLRSKRRHPPIRSSTTALASVNVVAIKTADGHWLARA